MSDAVSVLVAVDGSRSALGAVRWAALEAQTRARPLIIGAAVQTAVPLSAPAHDEDGELGEQAAAGVIALAKGARSRGEAALAQAEKVARAVLAPEHAVTTELWEGPPIPVLLGRSREVAMLVVGDRGLGDSPVVGSVPEALAAHGHCPVVVVRDWDPAEPGFGNGPIVVGVDGSPQGEAAIEQAIAAAAARGATLRAVHAWSDIPLGGEEGAGADGIDWGSVQQRHDATLAQALAGWQERYPSVEIERIVVNDRPVRHLLDAADGAQLLVVGSRGRGGFDGMMVGSTSRALLHTAPCPLLIARGD